MLIDVFPDILTIIRSRTDIAEGFGIFETELPCHEMEIVHEEMLHIREIRGLVIVSQNWQPFALLRQLLPEPRPGEPGNAIVNGHVSWWTGDAVFTHLSRLRAGDIIRVTQADGNVVSFKVTSKQVVDANARLAALFAPSSQATLTLITCTGIWNPLSQSDTQRLLVSASLV